MLRSSLASLDRWDKSTCDSSPFAWLLDRAEFLIAISANPPTIRALMRQSLILLLTLFLTISVFCQDTHLHNFGKLIAPESDAATLKMANDHANAALQYESQQQWVSAMNEYDEIIKGINSELAGWNESQQNQMLYYFLGLANTDHARMLLNMGANQLFVADYMGHLNDAEQALGKALALSTSGPVPASEIYTAMAVVKTFQGNYAGASADVKTLQQVNPNDQTVSKAAQALNTVPPANRQIGDNLRMYSLADKPIKLASAANTPVSQAQSAGGLTSEQKAALLHFGGAFVEIFFPKTSSLVEAGVEVMKAFRTPAAASAVEGR